MVRLPAIAPISDLRVRQAEIVELAQQGPVVLVERGSRPALVVVTPALWNELAERIEDLEDTVAIYQARLELAGGRDELIEISPETVADWMGHDLPAGDLPPGPA